MPISLIFPNESFGYRTITVERPLRDAEGKVVLGMKGKMKGKPMPDDGDLLGILATWAPDEKTRKLILADNPAERYGF